MTAWTDRDLPVLRWLHEHPPHDGVLLTNSMSKDPHPVLEGLAQQDVHVAVELLHDEGLVQCRSRSAYFGGGAQWIDFQVSGAGLQALGEWPIFDVLTSPADLGALLDALAELAANDEEEGNLRKAATTVRGKSSEALQTLAAGALSAVARSQLG